MTTAAEYFKVDPLSVYAWPITYRYWHSLPWGETRQTLTVDAPDIADNDAASRALGLELWKLCVAPATTQHLHLVAWETMQWKQSVLPAIDVPPFTSGSLTGAPAPREQTPVGILSSGGTDDFSE